MLLEEKLQVIHQLKKQKFNDYDYGCYSLVSTPKDHSEENAMVSKKLSYFCMRLLIAILLFVAFFLMEQKSLPFFEITTNDLQYYLTAHYLLP